MYPFYIGYINLYLALQVVEHQRN